MTGRIVQRCVVLVGVNVALAAVLAPSAVAIGSPGLIAGSVDDASSGAPLAGVCVYAYPIEHTPSAALGAPDVGTTAGDGSYEIAVGNDYGNYVVKFDATCGGTVLSSFATQYYIGALDSGSASMISVYALSPTTGVDAHLVPGFSLGGTVTAGPSGDTGACVDIEDSAGNIVSTTKTALDGSYSLSNLAAATYLVYVDPTCGGTQPSTYATQYYRTAPDPSTATGIDVSSNLSAVNVQLVQGASLSGMVSAPQTVDEAGICVDVVGPGGDVDASTTTVSSGAYRFQNLAPQTARLTVDPTCGRTQISYFGETTSASSYVLGAGQSVPDVDVALALNEVGPLSMQQKSLAVGHLSSNYFINLKFLGPSTDHTDYQWSATGLPDGLSLIFEETQEDPVFAAIGGTPSEKGSFRVTVTVTTTGSVPPLVLSQTYRLLIKGLAARVSVLSSHVRLSGSYVLVRLGCRNERCSGHAELWVPVPLPGDPRGYPWTHKLAAEADYSVPQGGTAILMLKLSSQGSRLLAKAKSHPVAATLDLSIDGGTQSMAALYVS